MTPSQSEPVAGSRETTSSSDATSARLGSVPIPVRVKLGERRMSFGDFVALRPGSFIPFPTKSDSPLELKAAEKTVALGQAVSCGTQLGLRITRFVSE